VNALKTANAVSALRIGIDIDENGSPNVLAGSPASGSQARGLILKMAAVVMPLMGPREARTVWLDARWNAPTGPVLDSRVRLPTPHAAPAPAPLFDSPEGPGPQM